MCPGVARTALLLTLSLGLCACGGSDSGPRGGGAEGSGGSGVGPAARPALRTVVYLPSYKGTLASFSQQLDFANISYVNLSFVDVDAEGAVSYLDSALPGFVSVAHRAGAKVCIALGGADTIDDGGVFATLLLDQHRPALVDNLVAFVKANGLDCLDIDLEGDGVNEYYEAFVTELAARLKPDGIELTAAVASWFGDRISPTALDTFDFVNIMAYDLYTSLETPTQTSSIEAATSEVERWIARGLPREKAVYGVPFYGKSWPAGGGVPDTIGYRDLLLMDPAAATQDHLQPNGKIIYLNSRTTIQAKAVLARNYGGIMAWEVAQDATGDASLLQAIREAVE